MLRPSRSATSLLAVLLVTAPLTLGQSPPFATTLTVHTSSSQLTNAFVDTATLTTSNSNTSPLHTYVKPAETVPTDATDLPPTQAPLSSPLASDATPANARQFAQMYTQDEGAGATPTYAYFMTENPVNYTPTPSAAGDGGNGDGGKQGGAVAQEARNGFALIAAAAAGMVGLWPIGG